METQARGTSVDSPSAREPFRLKSIHKNPHTHAYTDLGTRNISISDEAYSRLAAQKKENESFTDVVNRLTGKRSILEIAGILTKSGNKEVALQIEKMRKESRRRISSRRL